MTAITDIQRSLNAIRAIERESNADVRLSTLALLAATTADIAKELRDVERVPNRNNPKPLPPPKPSLSTVNQQQNQQTAPQAPTVARPFTEPELAQPQD